MAARNLFVCGKVVKPHGLKGELCIIWYADSPLLLQGPDKIFLRLPGKRPVPFRTVGLREHQKRLLLQLDNVSGRDQAEEWRDAEILVDARILPPADEEEIYLHQLLDCRVYLKSGAYIGLVQGFFPQKEGEVWQIVSEHGREVLFPAEDDFILELDPENRKIVIDPPEGLLDIYL
ncbi:ribosome maturation factor RimM [Desulfonatronospira sp.]|uniref:ribosome maturation factor RimM n=1 Tax=Desulfonatronospira sp. TaxID=1962951 RepID=UPI0025C1FBB8|nr:ribosome maturation factor RimM [Desulfonatronospira sp.]